MSFCHQSIGYWNQPVDFWDQPVNNWEQLVDNCFNRLEIQQYTFSGLALPLVKHNFVFLTTNNNIVKLILFKRISVAMEPAMLL